jgi:hypothetical protein
MPLVSWKFDTAATFDSPSRNVPLPRGARVRRVVSARDVERQLGHGADRHRKNGAVRVEDVRPINLPVTLRAGVRFILPEGPYGRTARRMFGAWRTRFTVSEGEFVVDGGPRSSRSSVRVDQVRYVKVWGANPLPIGWTSVEVATSDGRRLGVGVMRGRRLLGALRATGLDLFTNPAWPGVYARGEEPLRR